MVNELSRNSGNLTRLRALARMAARVATSGAIASRSEETMVKPDSGGTALATHDDIKSTLGEVDNEQMLEIMALRPTIADVERASIWLEGDPDMLGAGEALSGVASEIVDILVEDEDEDAPRAG
ncbi:hypothetical protein [Bradyrhizobium sp. WD16]|uniref:hypothetical protein n=1 Tax=Bradyrhizobium sp. WD16 TaxID=1521768 RepID=UPI0020A25F18|nr:hypothetical protein [Bradyrhizobium sp. WD16]